MTRDSFPRLQMALLVALTGGFGLLASFTMLQMGVDSMAVRYPLALACAYPFFLLLIWLWLRTNADDYVDVPDITDLIPRSGRPTGVPEFRSGGGDFGGGGASGTFEGPLNALDGAAAEPLKSVSDSVGSVADADEFAIPLVVIVLAIGIAFASLYIVYIAPVLFAEVLVDGALSYALLRRLRGQAPGHWLSVTVRSAPPCRALAVQAARASV